MQERKNLNCTDVFNSETKNRAHIMMTAIIAATIAVIFEAIFVPPELIVIVALITVLSPVLIAIIAYSYELQCKENHGKNKE